MSNLPRILVVDDVYGRSPGAGNRDRQMFCARAGLRDAAAATPQAGAEPVAEVVLASGQRVVDGRVENDLEGVMRAVRSGWPDWPRWALVLLDMHFQTGPIDPDSREAQGEAADRDPGRYFGLRILDELLSTEDFRGLPVVILSSMERARIEARFARQGVFAFVDKEDLDRATMRQLIWEHGLTADDRLLGRSLPMLTALREARRRSRLGNANIMTLGETGTGKELLADYMHRASGRTGALRKLFVRANEDMFSADLFGFVKGAFTGAHKDRAGEAEMAHEGTLFFDEFGDIPPGVQDRLLRLLDTSTREAQRIGDTHSRRLDLQLVMATNRFDIGESGFRRDLLQRANISSPVVLPPLRQRPGDIPLLAEFFVRRHEAALGAERREIAAEALAQLEDHAWPGNVRELEQRLLRAVSGYRGIRYLAAEHLVAAAPGAVSLPRPAGTAAAGTADNLAPSPAGSGPTTHLLADLLAGLEQVRFGVADRDSWMGRLDDVQAGHARLVARCLAAALEASSLASGEPRPTTAVRLLLGKDKLSTSEAASIIKRLLSISPGAIADLLAQPELHLGSTLEWAENLRGGSGNQRKEGRRRP